MQKFMVGVLLLSTAVTASGQIFGSAGAAKYVAPRGGTLPATCSFAQLFMKSGSGVGLYACTATDTWTLLGVTGAGTGDVIGPSASLDGEAALFDSTTGKLLKRFSGSGLMIATSGVPSVDSGLQWSNATKGIGVFGPITSGQTSTYQGKLYLNGLTSGAWGLTADADGSGASTTGKITATGGFFGALTGTASSATALASARTIYGVSFDGTGNIGSRTGNTSELASWTGTKTTGKQLGIDANGNIYASANDLGGSGSMVYPGAGIPVSTGSAWSTSVTAPTGAIVGAGQGNTFTTGAQDFGSATSLKIPTSAGAAPTASGLIAYDSTANQFKGGVNAANRIFLTSDSSGNTTLPGTLTVPGTGASNLTAIAAPAGTPAAGTADIYIDSTAKTFWVKDDAGAYSHTVKTKAAVSNQFVSAVADDGTVSTRAVAVGDLGLTTKGDLVVTTGAAINRLAVGTDGQALVADAASTNGVKWATVGGVSLATYSGNIDFGSIVDGACASSTFAATGALTTNYVVPIWPTLTNLTPAVMKVSASDTMSVTVCNFSGSSVDPASASFGALVVPTTTSSLGVSSGTSLPGTCTTGNMYVKSDATPITGMVYVCTSTNTWTQQVPTSLVVSGIVSGLAPVTYLQDADPCPTGTHCAVGATYNMGYIINGATTEASATYFDLPAAVAGMQYCFENGAGNSGATTGIMRVIAASGDYITLLGVKSGTSGTTATSNGAAGVAACFIAVKGDEWLMKTSGGTWTTN
jgi:hypothetical protein